MVGQSLTGSGEGSSYPVVFVAHFLEESPGFVPWFNAHVTRGITQDLFWTVNTTALLVTVLLTLWLSGPPNPRLRSFWSLPGSASDADDVWTIPVEKSRRS